jgi:hypothetical protein
MQAQGDNLPAIGKGCGETTWGQSLAEVQGFIQARARPDGIIFISYVNREICAAAEQERAREIFERREKEDPARTPKHKALGLEEIL